MSLKSLKTQIVLMSSLLVILLTLVATLILGLQQQRIYIGQYSNTATQLSKEIRAELVSSVSMIQQQLGFVGSVATFANLIRDTDERETNPESEQIRAQTRRVAFLILRAAIGPNNDYFAVSVIHGRSGMELRRLDKASQYVFAVEDREPLNFSNFPYMPAIRALEENEIFISPIEPLQTSDGGIDKSQPVIYLATAIKNEQGEFIGSIIVAVDFVSVFDRVTNIVSDQTLNGGLSLYLGDENGNYLYHPNQELRFDAAAGGVSDWRNSYAGIVTVGEPEVELFRTSSSLTSDLQRINIHGEELYALTTQFNLSALPGSPIINEMLNIPVRILNEQVLPPVINTVFLTALGGIAVTFIFALYSMRQLAPLTALSDSAKLIADGDYDAPLPYSRILEVRHLSESLKYLQSQVYKREKSLQASETELSDHKNNLEKIVEQRTGELTEARDEANRLVRVKSYFLANMSHEIRTPMTAILGLLDIMHKTEMTEPQQKYFRQIRNSSKALLNIINDILDISKIEAGKVVIEEAGFSLLQTLEEAIELFAPSADLKALDLCLKVDPQIRTHVAGDRTRLAQVLHNLIGNAIKFTQKGKISLAAEMVEETADTVRLKISVEDTGIGISEGAKQRLFEAFEQAEAATTRQFGGTGLGLTISQRLVELMGGELNLESKEGEGSSFWFEIDFRKQDEVEQLVVSHKCDLKVLIVDDQPLSCEILNTMLTTWGCKVTSAYTAEEGLKKLESPADSNNPYDLAIIDWRLPGMDGLQLASEIKSMQSTGKQLCRAMIIHTEADRAEIIRAPNYQEDLEVLMKPVTMSRLLNVFVELGLISLVQNAGSKLGNEVDADQLHKVIEKLGSPGEVLVVEDNMTNQIVIQEILSDYNLNVSIANHGEEAVKKVQSRHFDLVLMDLQMPVMDGFEATREIRKIDRLSNLPVLALSAAIFTEDVQQASRAGMNDHLVKPIDLEKLLEALSKWLPIGRQSMSSSESANLDSKGGPGKK